MFTAVVKMILGISLVVQELNKGPRMLFRYPEEKVSILTPVEEEDGESKVNTNEFVKEGSKISLDALNNEATATTKQLQQATIA